MKTHTKTIEIKLERTIPAPPDEVFDGWLNPKIPGNPWNVADKFILNPKVDGLFYWTLKGTSHYGRFTEIDIDVVSNGMQQLEKRKRLITGSQIAALHERRRHLLPPKMINCVAQSCISVIA